MKIKKLLWRVMLQQRLINKDTVFLLLSLILFFLVVPKECICSDENSSADIKSKIKGPVVIKSDRLTADNLNNTALFEGAVVATTPDMTMYSDKMLVFYERKTGNIKKIESEGKVKVIKGDRVIVSQKAVYYADGEKVVFMGEPRAVEDKNTVIGDVMTYFINEDRYYVEGAKVFLSEEKEK